MLASEFKKIVEERIKKIRCTLEVKEREYATTEDRLHNFKAAASLMRVSQEEALLGMLAKHIVSIVDMVKTPGAYPLSQWDEKLGDAINYLILLEALLKRNLVKSLVIGPDGMTYGIKFRMT